jgi:hypothetical protein
MTFGTLDSCPEHFKTKYQNCVFYSNEELLSIQALVAEGLTMLERPVTPFHELQVLQIKSTGGDPSGGFAEIEVESSLGEKYSLQDKSGMLTRTLLYVLFQNQTFLQGQSAPKSTDPNFLLYQELSEKAHQYLNHRKLMCFSSSSQLPRLNYDNDIPLMRYLNEKDKIDFKSNLTNANQRGLSSMGFQAQWKEHGQDLAHFASQFPVETADTILFRLEALGTMGLDPETRPEVKLTGDLEKVLSGFKESLERTPTVLWNLEFPEMKSCFFD